MTSNAGIVLGPGGGKIVLVPGHKITRKVVGADTDGAYSLLEVRAYTGEMYKEIGNRNAMMSDTTTLLHNQTRFE